MKLLDKEQIAYGLLKAVEVEKAYSKWFTIFVNQNFKDIEDQEAWDEDLQKAIDLYDTNQKKLELEEKTIFDELDEKYEGYGQPKLTSQDWIDSLSLLRYETDDEVKMFKLIYRHLSKEELAELLTDIVIRRESFHTHIINIENVRYKNGIYFFGPKQ